jgi:RimJ/RimL family protein N-acetyltransferase
MILQTPRLILRPFREEDVDLLAEPMANEDFMRFSLGVYSCKQTAAFLEKILTWQNRALPSQFAVLSCAHNRLIGYSGFFHQEVDGTSEIEIGYRLHPNYWNKGLATEAAQAVRDHAFRDLNLSRVISLIHPENAASRRVAEKMRMQFRAQNRFQRIPSAGFRD